MVIFIDCIDVLFDLLVCVLCWSLVWDMCCDVEMCVQDYVILVGKGLFSEIDFIVVIVFICQVIIVVILYSNVEDCQEVCDCFVVIFVIGF